MEHVTSSIARAEDDWRVLAGIHIVQYSRGRGIFRVEERGEEMRRRGLVDQPIDVAYEHGKVQVGMRCLGPEGSLETSHDQGRADSLPGDISDGDAPTVPLQRQKVVVVASDFLSRFVERFAR